MNKFVVFAITTLSSTLMACSSAPTSNHVNYGVPFVNRTLPERMIDEGIEHTVLRNLPNVAGMENIQNHQMRMAVDSFRREVLLTGEVPNQVISQNVNSMVASMNDVTKIYNYLNIGTPKTQTNTLQDNFLKSKILARLVTDRSVKASQYKLVVRDNVVYLMGYLTQAQQNRIMDAIRQTPGVERVVLLSNLVTYLDTPTSPANNNYGNNYSNNYGNYNPNGGVNGGYNYSNLPTNNTPAPQYNNPPAYNPTPMPYYPSTPPNYPSAPTYNPYSPTYNYGNNTNNTYNYGNYGNTNQNNNGRRPASSYVQLYSGTNMPWCCGVIDYLV